MPASASPVTLLVRRVRTRLWLELLLARLRRALWVTAPILVLGGLLRWRLGLPDLSLLALLSCSPLLLALLATVRRRPTADEAAAAADRRLRAGSLLMTAWHLDRNRERRADAAPLVTEQARRALPGWTAQMRKLRSTLQAGALWPPLLALIASLPLLGLEPVSGTLPSARDKPGAAAPAEHAVPLLDLVAELKASEVLPEPVEETSALTPVPTPAGGTDAIPLAEESSAGPAPDRTAQGGPNIRVAPSKSAHIAAGEGGDPDPAQTTGGDGVAGGRESAGIRDAAPAESRRDANAGETVPERLSALHRRDADHNASTGPGGILVPNTRHIGAHADVAAAPAEPPPGMERDLVTRGPAGRALVARFFELSRQQNNE